MKDTSFGKLIWIQAQQASPDLFEKGLPIGDDPTAGGGKIIYIQPPGQQVTFHVPVDVDGLFDFRVFLRYTCTCPDTFISVSVNNNEIHKLAEMPVTEKLSGDFRYMAVGKVQLPKGLHVLNIAKTTGFYHLDAVILVEDEKFVTEGHAEKYFRGEWKKLEKEQMPLPHPMWREETYRNGVPLGGIGAGKLEITPEGILTNIAVNNNQDCPVFNAPGCLFALSEKSSAGRVARTLQTTGGWGLEGAKGIEFNGAFPRAHLSLQDHSFRLRINLEAFSGLIPHDLKDSSLPGAVFVFDAENPWQEPVELSVAFSWENFLGCGGWSQKVKDGKRPLINREAVRYPTWNDRDGNFQEGIDAQEYAGIHFRAASDNGYPLSFGEYVILAERASQGEVSRNLCWNLLGDEGQGVFKTFADTGKLPQAADASIRGNEDSFHPAASISVTKTIPAGERREFVFVLAWHTPNVVDNKGRKYGVYYENYFEDALSVGRYLLAQRERILRESTEIERLLGESNLPDFLKKKLCDDMFPAYSCSWLAKDGRFSINEAPTMMGGCYGTMDQRLCSHIIYTLFWPELDRSELKLFVKQQSPEGRIPHDVGHGDLFEGLHVDWPDLASAFVLEAYHHWVWTGDKRFIRRMYPRMKKALEWAQSLDDDADGIPDLGAGRGTTYDTYQWFGACSFVATLHMAACKALAKSARFCGDEDEARRWQESAARARTSMEEKLFNGKYFIAYDDRGKSARVSENCSLPQLAGQWFSRLADLGNLLDPAKIRSALKAAFHLTVDPAGCRAFYDEVEKDGTPAWYGYAFFQYSQVYFGCTAIYEGLVEEGLRVFEKAHRVAYEINHNPWRTHLCVYGKNGKSTGLPWYMTNPASWFVLYALSGFLPDRAGKRLLLDPRMDRLYMPLFAPTFWGWLSYESSSAPRPSKRFRLQADREVAPGGAQFNSFETYLPKGAGNISVKWNGRSARHFHDVSNGRVRIERRFNLSKSPLHIDVSYDVAGPA